jgi:hypothetical protein
MKLLTNVIIVIKVVKYAAVRATLCALNVIQIIILFSLQTHVPNNVHKVILGWMR